jgi:hypothetical protein
MLHVTLHVHLRFLTVGGRGQSGDAKYARADALGNGLYCSAFAGGIAALEHDYHPQALVFHPFLKLAKLRLKAAQFLLILFALNFSFGRIVVHQHDLLMRIPGRGDSTNMRRLEFLSSAESKELNMENSNSVD